MTIWPLASIVVFTMHHYFLSSSQWATSPESFHFCCSNRMGLIKMSGLKKKKKWLISPCSSAHVHIFKKKFVQSFWYECQVEIQSCLHSLLNFSLKQMCSKELNVILEASECSGQILLTQSSPAARSGCCTSLQEEMWKRCFAATALVALGNQAP